MTSYASVLFTPNNWTKPTGRSGCRCPACAVSCTHAALRASLGGAARPQAAPSVTESPGSISRATAFPRQGGTSAFLELLLLERLHWLIPRQGWGAAGSRLGPSTPTAGGVGPIWDVLSLLFGKKRGPSGAPWGPAFPIYHRAKPDSWGSLAEKMVLRGVCRKEPTA